MNATIRKFTRLVFSVYIIGVLSLTFIVRETMILRTPDNRGVILEPFREIDATSAKSLFLVYANIP